MSGEQPIQCTIDTCPVSESIYGYAPGLGENVFFTILFAVLAVAHAVQGSLHKTWSFLIAMCLGSASEAIGHGGRIILHSDAFNDSGFYIQIILLTIAPAFLAAGIYLCLKHLVITFGEDLSRIRPKFYTWIFISCDFVSLALQGAGGGVAATADDGDKAMLDAGNNLMLAGLSFQVFTLAVFALMAGDYFNRVLQDVKKNGGGRLNPATTTLRNSLNFKLFCASLTLSYVAIMIRCVYRIIEMAGGWGNPIMQKEGLFIGLDSTMCALAVLVFNFWHPGRSFNYQGFGHRAIGENQPDIMLEEHKNSSDESTNYRYRD
ncbi:putative RTA1 domain protein [Eremomyces bilateralis CBS 781.70]|uniref:RTA1 domain protein n=1 Tax=Eremomyces bilateralis CBS 781.70 TaxID=1392243 RepID=A0A6G1FVW7_9PEZI|nr:putative RTA1 domain protein [Eremomyces bilateralis CBS 781.70]KAF1809832.1 putative RTA1 domain protein [Eremomyces bilateralis CBS 781.70]